MSVTFFPEAIKYKKVAISCTCKEYNNDVPEEDCWECKGTGFYEDLEPEEGFFECGYSNINARNILQVAIPEIYYEDLCGSWDSNLQDRATKNLLKALNKENNPLLRETLEEGNFITCGIDLTQAERQITILLKVLQNCKKHNCNLNFA